MQLFGLDSHPAHAASKLCDTHVCKQLLESTQILYTALSIHGAVPPQRVDCSEFGKGEREAYKPFSKNHPIVRWASAAKTHWRWVLAHANALSNEYEHRSGKRHLCTAFVQHVDNFHTTDGLPNTMPDTVSVDEWLASLDDKRRTAWAPRVATQLPPDGCTFGIVALTSFDSPDPNNWVESYKAYYGYRKVQWAERRDKRPIRMQWSSAGEMGSKRNRA